jgi:hypothetical protein
MNDFVTGIEVVEIRIFCQGFFSFFFKGRLCGPDDGGLTAFVFCLPLLKCFVRNGVIVDQMNQGSLFTADRRLLQ